MQIKIDELLKLLGSSKIVSQIAEVIIDETASRSYYKIRCKLIPDNYKLQIKYSGQKRNRRFANHSTKHRSISYREGLILWISKKLM